METRFFLTRCIAAATVGTPVFGAQFLAALKLRAQLLVRDLVQIARVTHSGMSSSSNPAGLGARCLRRFTGLGARALSTEAA